MQALFSTYRKEIILTCGSLLTGFFIGGLLLGASTETRTFTEFVEIEKEKIVEVDRVVEKTIEKKVYLKADKMKEVETRQADGTVTFQRELYGLGVSTEQREKLKVEESSKEVETAKEIHETSSVVQTNKNSISLGYIVDWHNPLSFDYKTDWTVSYDRYLFSSPFSGRVSVGPRFVGLGLGFSF